MNIVLERRKQLWQTARGNMVHSVGQTITIISKVHYPILHHLQLSVCRNLFSVCWGTKCSALNLSLWYVHPDLKINHHPFNS